MNPLATQHGTADSCLQFTSTGETVDNFIERYIFPGGYLPSINQLLTSIHNGSRGDLEVETVQSIGPHYIRTLQCWRENFDANWETIRQDFVSKSPSATESAIEAYRRQWVVCKPSSHEGSAIRLLTSVAAVLLPILRGGFQNSNSGKLCHFCHPDALA